MTKVKPNNVRLSKIDGFVLGYRHLACIQTCWNKVYIFIIHK